MDREARARRGDRPTVFTSLVEPDGARPVIDWLAPLLAARRATARGAT